MNKNKVATSFCNYIEYFDWNRLPIKSYLRSLPQLNIFWERFNIKKYDPKFYEEIRKNDSWYLNKLKRLHGKEPGILLLLIFPLLFLFLIISIALNLSSKSAKIVLVIFMGVYFIYAMYRMYNLYMKTKEKIGQENDQQLKGIVQKVIDYTKEFFKRENLNPKDFPIKLRHNDYKDLTYEEKGKNKYIAYIDLK